MIAIARENEKIVWEEMLPLVRIRERDSRRITNYQDAGEHVVGLTADPVSRTYWVYTDKSILEVLVKNEDRDVWRAKLEKGDHSGALSFVKVSLSLHPSTTLLTHHSLLLSAISFFPNKEMAFSSRDALSRQHNVMPNPAGRSNTSAYDLSTSTSGMH